jgi:glycosyl transferase family 87
MRTSMNSFFAHAWTTLLLVGLTAYVFSKGVVPAMSEVTADFPGYFTSARIVIDGQETQRLYDDDWFREQIRRYGLESANNPGKFAPFPPPTALLLVPLARFEPLTALRIVTVVSVLCLIGSIFLLARILAWNPLDSALFILSSGLAIIGGLRCGQPYIVISMFCILGYYLYLQRRPWLAGICLGLFVPIKYFPAIILAYFVFRKEWKVVMGGAAAIAAVGLLSIAVLGWKVHEIFILSVFGNHLIGRLSLQDQTVPFTAVYQSFDTLFARLFVFDPVRNPQPLAAAPLLRTVSLVAVKGSILLIAVATLAKLARRGAASAAAPSIGILGIVLFLIAPATATYTCALLWLPVALLVDYFLRKGARMPAYFILGVYALIGFVPYNYAYPFEGHGGLSLLAYPRLFLLFAMFIGCAYFIVYPRPPGQDGVRIQDPVPPISVRD